MEEKERPKGKGDASLEALRLEYTDLSQEQFISRVGLNRTTYRRWMADNSQPRLTPEQITNICALCQVPFDIFFERMGVNIDALKRNRPKEEERPPSSEELEIPSAQTLAILAKRLSLSLKTLYGAYGLNIDGIPDDCPQSVPPEKRNSTSANTQGEGMRGT